MRLGRATDQAPGTISGRIENRDASLAEPFLSPHRHLPPSSPPPCAKSSLYTSGRPVSRSETRAVSSPFVSPLISLPNAPPIGELYTLEHGLNVRDEPCALTSPACHTHPLSPAAGRSPLGELEHPQRRRLLHLLLRDRLGQVRSPLSIHRPRAWRHRRCQERPLPLSLPPRDDDLRQGGRGEQL